VFAGVRIMLLVPRLVFVVVSVAVPTAHNGPLTGQVVDRGTVNCCCVMVMEPTCTLHAWPKTNPELAATAANGSKMAHVSKR